MTPILLRRVHRRVKSIRIHPSGRFHQNAPQEAPIGMEQADRLQGSNGRLGREGLHRLGKDKTAGEVSNVRSRSEFSQEEDRAQEHVGVHQIGVRRTGTGQGEGELCQGNWHKHHEEEELCQEVDTQLQEKRSKETRSSVGKLSTQLKERRNKKVGNTPQEEQERCCRQHLTNT
ncbi:uncharacterized protein UBRO_20642 [Ustilago bromivora]|uniref:Uncharacterized protein n=1 Tax=Ustilago bromivora TaxID=307758 RepID=A0A1K0G433_9BASI|nr:uncharacterized protein UBRO_20642 [Ustilago bromivora]